MKVFLLGSVAFACALSVGSVRAFELRQQSLEERISISDVIFVGTSVGDGGMDPEVGNYGSFMLSVDSTLKGQVSASPQRFVAKGEVVEANVDCYELGATYLILALRKKDGSLKPVNGPYSVFKIEANVVLNWPNGLPNERCDWEFVKKLIESSVNQSGRR